MYKIIGNDGKTYGPVPAERIREWIVQGRVDSRTTVLAEGAADWTFIGLLPEFAREFSGPPPVTAPPKMAALPVQKHQWICHCRIHLRPAFLGVLLRLSVQRARADFFHHRAGANQRAGGKTARAGVWRWQA